MTLLVGALTIGLVLSLLALGVYISFRIFHFPDITADGSITFGAAIAAVLAVNGWNPLLATLVVLTGGVAAGAMTGILHTRFKIHGLLSGILVMTALYSVNLLVMGRSNVPLVSREVDISSGDIRDANALVGSLRQPRDQAQAAVFGAFSEAARAEVLAHDQGRPVPESLKRTLAAELSNLVRGPALYENEAFATSGAPQELREDILTEHRGEEVARGNRRLLDRCFAGAVHPFRELRTLELLAAGASAELAGGRKTISLLDRKLSIGPWQVGAQWEIGVRDAAALVASLLVVSLVSTLLYVFFRTNLGTAMRATGDNPEMIRALGVNVDNMIILGLAISNGLIALSGAMLAQYQGFADVQMGIGMIVWGLASVIIGEALIGSTSLGLTIIGAVMGSVLFRLLVAIALRWGLDPNYLKLVTAVFVFCALVLPRLMAGWRERSRVRHA